jgi:HK97 family phage prohead protease
MKLHRQVGIAWKSIPDNVPPGTFEAIVSVFGNKDSMNEVVMPGAFTGSLQSRGLPKICWGHDWLEIIGSAVEARELSPGDPLLPPQISTNGGLWLRAQLELETQRGKEAYTLLKNGHVTEFSIGYRVLRAHRVTEEGDSVDDTYGYGYYGNPKSIRYLDELELYEASPVLAGANDRTALIGVKDGMPFGDQLDVSLEAFKGVYAEAVAYLERRQKEGRTFSAANMGKLEGFASSLEEISSGLRGLLDTAKGESSKADEGEQEAADETPNAEIKASALAELARFEHLILATA